MSLDQIFTIPCVSCCLMKFCCLIKKPALTSFRRDKSEICEKLMKLKILWIKKHNNIEAIKPKNKLKFIRKNSKLFNKKYESLKKI